jgi:uncharacterized protein YggE
MTKHVILFAAVLLISFSTFAQNGEHVIRVKGLGKTKISPDQVIAHIAVQSVQNDYAFAIKKLNDKVDYFTRLLKKADFGTDEVKMSNIDFGKNYEYTQQGRQEAGYRAMQSLTLEFSYNKDRIADLLGGLSNSKEDYEINFNFTLSDELQEKSRTEVIALAVTDARNKAETIARAAGISLSAILRINYGEANSPFVPMRSETFMRSSEKMDDAGAMSNFEAREIEISDELWVEYQFNK